MRILITTDTVGGVWTFTRELACNLLVRGHEVGVVSFGPSPSRYQESWWRSMERQWGDKFLCASIDSPLEWMQDNSSVFALGAEKLCRIADEFNADLLHSNQFCWGALPVSIPRIVTAHSDVMSWGACCHPNGMPPSEWLTRYRVLVQNGLDGAEAVVAPTVWMRNALLSHFEVLSKFLVIPNGRTVPGVADSPPRKLQAVSVGRLWDEGKGMRTLLQVESPLPIYVAGETAFESACAPISSLRAAGNLDEEALFDLFRASIAYIATSLYEPFGLAPLEAALCGCAIVARNLPSFREVWSDAALYFDTAEELAGTLRELVNNVDLVCRARAKAYTRAERYAATTMADRYCELYRTLVSGPDGMAMPISGAATNV